MVPRKYFKKTPNKTQEKSPEISNQEFTLGDQKPVIDVCVATDTEETCIQNVPFVCLLSLGQNL